jgi:hypothetical protein
MKPRPILIAVITAFLVLITILSSSEAFSLPPIPRQEATPQLLAGPMLQYIPFIKNNIPPATPTPKPTLAPSPTSVGNPPPADEWTQHGHDAQHTSYTATSIPTPWHWKWSWNGPAANGAVSAGKITLPRNVQPVTGGGRVYIAAGANGVYALNNSNGSAAWNNNTLGTINSTPAYDDQTGSLFVVSTNGHLYRLNAATGQSNGDYNGQATSTLPLPPAVYGTKVYFSMGNHVFAINKSSLSLAWSYDAGSPVQTPPAVSPASGLVVAGSEDLYFHAIHDSNGTRSWRVKPTSLSPGDPGDNNPNAEVKYGWPVIADVHGLVLVRLRLNWQTLWTWNPWPTTNAQMRTNLVSRPDQQSLFAMRLSDGGTAFVSNVGNGGFGDGGRLNIGPQPVVKRFADGSEAAYVVMRGSNCINTPCDGRYDSHLGEMMLDSSTVSGFQQGQVRFMQNTFFPTDEQLNLSMAGDDIFGGHWMFGIAHHILDRSPSRGASSGTPITTSNLPHIITSTQTCSFSSSHYCSTNMIQDGDPRSIPAGFYIYYNQGQVYNQYWRGYSAWVVSGSNLYFLSNDGALVVLESGPTIQSTSEVAGALPPAQPQILAQPIPYTAAWESAGKIATVEGEVKFMFNNRKAVLLGFENPHMGAFKALILVDSWQNFSPAPEALYTIGQKVKVHGLIDWYQGDPVIYVSRPEQIEVISGPSPTQP